MMMPIALGLGAVVKGVQYLIENTFPSSFVPGAYKDDSLSLKMRKVYENSFPWITRSTIYDMMWRSLPAGFAITYVLWKKKMGSAIIDSSDKKVLAFFMGFIGVTTIAAMASKVRELLYAMTEKIVKRVPATEEYIRPVANYMVGPSEVIYEEEGDLKGKRAPLWYPAGQELTKADETYGMLSIAAFFGVIVLLTLNQKLSKVAHKINGEIQSWERMPKPWTTVAAFGLFRIFCCYKRICEEVKQCQEDLAKQDLSFRGRMWRGMRLLWNGCCIVANLNDIRKNTMTITKATAAKLNA